MVRIAVQTTVNERLCGGLQDKKLEVVEFLLQNGETHNPNSDVRTPFYTAAESGYIDVMQFLLYDGARLIAENRGLTPLYYAISRDHTDAVELLLSVLLS